MTCAMVKHTAMQIKFLLLLCCFQFNSLSAQNHEERALVEAKIYSLFEGMKLGDSAKVRCVYHCEARVISTR